jgi:ERCC4-type nuclease
MNVFLDIREHALIDLMPNLPTEQLLVGDIWIGKGQEGGIVIERKTTADFEASILDGRYREQRTRLLAYCSENKARPMYIIEEGLKGRTRTLQPQSLQKMLNRLMLRYGVAVWLTESIEDTVRAIEILDSQFKDDATVFIGKTLSYTDVMHTAKKDNTGDPKIFAISCLVNCPGVSAKAASALIEVFGTLKSVMEQTEATLADVKVGTRRFGPAAAKKLLALLNPVA